MTPLFKFAGAMCVLACWLVAEEPGTVTWTGWFSDAKCATGRVAFGMFASTNPDCARQCIGAGAVPVFISEQAKALFEVKGYPALVDDLGYHMEVRATVDDAAKTITIQKTTRLGYDGAACSRPKKPAAKQ
jgi:hypothetical protein